MKRKEDKHRILILGGSGFIGHAIYKELRSYFEIYCTYFSKDKNYSENSIFISFDIEKNSMSSLLQDINPTIIISAIKGSFTKSYKAHEEIVFYINKNPQAQLLYFSNIKVFDAKYSLPSYENDTTISISDQGRFLISIEKLILKKIPYQSAILRLPILMGYNSPTMLYLRQCIKHDMTFDIYPNLVISANTISKVSQQVHYIINQTLIGVFHLSSNDLIHHEEFFRNIASLISPKTPIFKSIYSSNEDSYAAMLPKWNKLPQNYQISIEQIIQTTVLNEEITCLSL